MRKNIFAWVSLAFEFKKILMVLLAAFCRQLGA
jgi:hypothetical protein